MERLTVMEKCSKIFDHFMNKINARTEQILNFDITDNTGHWVNSSFAQYYGLHTVRTEPLKDEE